MKAYFSTKCKSKQEIAERKAFIVYNMVINNITQTQIANELGMSSRAISQFISGRTISKNISKWFLQNLKIEV